MRERTRILFSARDPGAVGHITALLAAFRVDERFEVDLVASGLALDLFRKAGVSPRSFALQDGRDHLNEGECPTPLLDPAGRLLAEIQPDAIFVSLSSFGVGIDEALLARVRGPSFAIQDFWGDVNLGLGVPARLYFVHDEHAVRLTRARWGVQAVAVGSPKHSRYADMDVGALRESRRELIGIGDGQKVIGFFGQGPAVPGEEMAFRELVAAAAAIRPKPLFVLREHPKFSWMRGIYHSLARHSGLQVIDATDKGDPEGWLAVCDVVVTPFSLCGLDYSYLSAYSREPIGSVVYLMTNHELRSFAEHACGMKSLPIVQQGMGHVAETADEILPCLENALSNRCARAFFAASKSLRKGNPCQNILDAVGEILFASEGASR